MKRCLPVPCPYGVLSVLSLLVAVSAYAADVPTAPTRGGSVTYASARMPSVLVPSIEPSAGVTMIGAKVLEGLFTVGPNNVILPRLALSMTSSDDGKAFTLNLRKGVKWHDGQAFSSADVAFSMMSVWKIFVSNSAFDAVIAADTPRPDVVIFRTSRQVSPQYLMATFGNGAVVVLPRHLYEGKDLRTNPVNQRPIGTGPFKVGQRDQSQFVTLDRNPDYWDPKLPYLDRLIFRVITDDGAAAAALEANEIQLMPASAISIGDAKRFASGSTIGITTKGYEGFPWFASLIFNLGRPVLQDLRVRQAIAYALDRSFIAQSPYGGFAKPAASIFRRSDKNFTSVDLPSYPFDPAKARALLGQAGIGGNKPRLKLRMLVAPFSEGMRSTGEYITQALGAVGIDVQLVQPDIAGFIRQVYRDYDFDIALSVVTGGPDPAQSLPSYFWSKTIDKIAFHNASQYKSSQLDYVVERLASEQDPAKRIELAHDFGRIVMRDLPVLPLVEIDYYTAHRKSLQNVADTPQWLYSSWADLWIKP